MPENRLQRTRTAYDTPEDVQRNWLDFLRELNGPMIDDVRYEVDPVTHRTIQVRIPRQFTVRP